MIDPENSTPLNESENDAEDQLSQQDFHSDGIEGTDDTIVGETEPDIEGLQAADKASEASYTLDVDRGTAPKQENATGDGNLKHS